MGSQINHLLELKAHTGDGLRHVFLVEQAGSDFTFYVRDDAKAESERLCQILQGGGRAAQKGGPGAAGLEGEDEEGADVSPVEETLARLFKESLAGREQDFSFSCRVNVLRPLLNKDDFVWGKRGVLFLQRLRAAENGRAAGRNYAALLPKLKKGTRKSLNGSPEDAKLLETVIGELNKLLADGLTRKLSDRPLRGVEKELFEQVKDPDARGRLGDYLRLCSHFGNSIKPVESRIRSGRVLGALSYEGRVWSITFRKQETGTGYEPDEKIDGTLNSIAELCRVLYEEVFSAVSRSEATGDVNKQGAVEPPEVGGLVVVAGSTNSAKSLITRGLIHLYLEDALSGRSKRRPHLVTFEDPIEKYFSTAAGASDGAGGALEGRVDYTPRQQGKDAADLDEALHEALRQTPKVFFVGETRRNEDWRRLLDFAATGHLVVTTAHAGSLIEAMHKILLAAKAKTPADRSEVASRLLAVVHLKRAEFAEFEKCAVLVPSLWRRVKRGKDSLTAEGLASILPHSHSDKGNPASSLGRKYFAALLLQQSGARVADPRFPTALKRKATEWDLKGD